MARARRRASPRPSPCADIADLDILAHGEPAKQPHRLEGAHDAGAGKAVTRQARAIALADDDRAGDAAAGSRTAH